jgi:hypothetical protein
LLPGTWPWALHTLTPARNILYLLAPHSGSLHGLLNSVLSLDPALPHHTVGEKKHLCLTHPRFMDDAYITKDQINKRKA